jgi:hypothetical protein
MYVRNLSEAVLVSPKTKIKTYERSVSGKCLFLLRGLGCQGTTVTGV